jgi:hypothetical protein
MRKSWNAADASSRIRSGSSNDNFGGDIIGGDVMSEGWLDRIEVRLSGQLRFLIDAERLKSVTRASRIADGWRRENAAEHGSWCCLR